MSAVAARAFVHDHPASEVAPQLAAVLRAQRRIVSALPDADAVAATVAAEALALVGADGAAVEVVEGVDLIQRGWVGHEPRPVSRRPAAASLSGATVRGSEALVVRDAASDPRVDHATGEAPGMRSIIAVPLRAGSVAIGVLKVFCERPDAFQDSDVQVLQILAGVAGDAVRHAIDHDTRERMASLGRVAAGMAHEINNPLAYVSANLDHVLEAFEEHTTGLSPAEVSRLALALTDAREGATRIAAIVGQLRSFARGRAESLAPLDLIPIVKSAVKLASHEIKHRCRLTESYEAVPSIEGNEVRLGQVILNLLVNAAQSLASGEKSCVQVRTYTDRKGRAVVEVEDSGSGIAREHLAHVFEPFFTTKAIGAGMGLGLSICYGIVTAHGGNITVDSEVGRGSTFRVVLPRAAHATTTAVATSPSGRYRTRRARVLVVDDEPNVCAALQRLLSDDHDVEVCHGAGEAQRRLMEKDDVDVIVCDLMMTDRSGHALYAELIAARPSLAERIVFMTGGAFTKESAEFLASMVNPPLEKPCDTAVLRETIQRIAQRTS